jgi:hypothetical protein
MDCKDYISGGLDDDCILRVPKLSNSSIMIAWDQDSLRIPVRQFIAGCLRYL